MKSIQANKQTKPGISCRANISQLAGQATDRYIFNNTESDLQIDILSEIDEWWGYGVQALAYDLMGNKGKPVKVRINSLGGSYTEAIAIRNVLRGLSEEVYTTGIGIVASAATFILLAGDKGRVNMAKNAYVMIHNPWVFASGESEDLEKGAEMLRKIEGDMAEIYTDAIEARGKLVNGSREETLVQVRAWMKAETWFNADEALDHGLIDGVTDGEDFLTQDNAEEVLNALDSFNSIPGELLNTVKNFAKMSNKKTGLLGQIKNLLSSSQTDTPSAEAEAAEEETTATEVTQEQIDAARELLAGNGYTVEPIGDEDIEVPGPDDDGTEEEEAEEGTLQGVSEEQLEEALAAIVDQRVAAALEQQVKPGARKRAGTQSGGTTKVSKNSKPVSAAAKKRGEVYSNMAKKVISS